MVARVGGFVCLCIAFFNSGVQGQTCDDVIPLLPELERRARNYVANVITDPYINDLNLKSQWYRVKTARGQYKMPDRKPSIGTCGTYQPIYLRDKHPDVANLTSNPTPVIACLRNTFSECDVEYDVLIRNCSGDIQYNLPFTSSFSGYCFDPPDLQNVSLDGVSSAPTNATLGTIKIEPELLFDQAQFIDGSTNYFPYVIFKCTFNTEEKLFYTINWYIDGDYFHQTGPSNQTVDFQLSERYLMNNTIENVTLGFTIRCGVRISKNTTGLTTSANFSENFFAGLKVKTPNIELQKGGYSTITFQPTIPIGCRYNTMDPPGSCELGLNVVDPAEYYTCGQGNLVKTSEHRRCGSDIRTLKFGETFDPSSEFEMNITTSDVNYNDPRTYTLHLRTYENSGNKLWSGYNLDQVKVTVIDDESYKNKNCYSHVDPHLKTADNKWYELHHEGEFLFYRNTAYETEVHTKTKLCFPNVKLETCACGVAIRAGADVFMINLCGSVNFIGFLSCEDGGILHVIEENSNHYNIYTPIGTWISVTIQGRSFRNKFLNIDITLSPKDVQNTEGLCGNFNNDKNDDDTANFKDLWSLSNNTSMFRTVKPRELTRWEETNGFFCVCEQALPNSALPTQRVAQAYCAPTQYLNCTFDRDVTEKKCFLAKSGRRRSVDHFQREIDTLLELMRKPRVSHSNSRQKRQGTEYILSEADAKGNCSEIISESLAVKNYSDSLVGEDPDEVIKQCVIDVMAGNDRTLGDFHVESLNDRVKRTFQLDPAFVANNKETVETFIVNTCRSNCSARGTCSNGECICSSGYHGADCSIANVDLIDVDYIEGGNLCDLSEGGECTCFYVFTSQLIDNFTCQFYKREVDSNFNVSSTSTTTVIGERYDIFSGFCCLSGTRTKRSTSVTFATFYDIALSNSGSNFGEAFTVALYDSTCQTASVNNDNTTSIQLMNGYCFIDGQCVVDGDLHINEACFGCNTSLNSFRWTVVCDDSKVDNQVVIVIAIVGGILLLVVLVLVVTCVLWKKKCRGKSRHTPTIGHSQTSLQSDNRERHERPMSAGGKSIGAVSIHFDNTSYCDLGEQTKEGDDCQYETLDEPDKWYSASKVDQSSSEYNTTDTATYQNQPSDATSHLFTAKKSTTKP